MSAVATCPSCTRLSEVRLAVLPDPERPMERVRRPLPGQRCRHCDGLMDAAQEARPVQHKAEKPVAEVLGGLLDAMLAQADWTAIPLADKLSIAATVAARAEARR